MLDQGKETFGIPFGVDEDLRHHMEEDFFLRRGRLLCIRKKVITMTEAEWEKVLKIYASYGVNCMRFHSWCHREACLSGQQISWE